MFVYCVLLSASLLAFAGAPWWIVPIGAVSLLFASRDEIRATAVRSLSSNPAYALGLSIAIKLARNMVFVAVSFGLGLAAAWLFGLGDTGQSSAR